MAVAVEDEGVAVVAGYVVVKVVFGEDEVLEKVRIVEELVVGRREKGRAEGAVLMVLETLGARKGLGHILGDSPARPRGRSVQSGHEQWEVEEERQ